MCKLITLVNLLSTIESRPIFNDVIVQISVLQDKVPCIPAIYDKETIRHTFYVSIAFDSNVQIKSRQYNNNVITSSIKLNFSFTFLLIRMLQFHVPHFRLLLP